MALNLRELNKFVALHFTLVGFDSQYCCQNHTGIKNFRRPHFVIKLMKKFIKKNPDVSKRECDDESLVGLESWGLNVMCQICHSPEKNILEAPSYCLFKAPVHLP